MDKTDQKMRLITMEGNIRDFEGRHSAVDLCAIVCRLQAQAPEEWRSAVRFDIDHSYEEGWSVEIWYKRPETDEDRAIDERDRRLRHDTEEMRERLMYERLKAKFG